MKEAIFVEGLTKAYDGKTVVDHLNLSVKSGTVFGLLGANGAFVIDTPGMRELGMWDSGDGIDTAFADIEELSRACKYADCTHTSEPGCAVLRALADGILDDARLSSYRKLKTENDYAADNSRYLEAKRARFKEIAKINKSRRKSRY